jgi:hypothetical protein
MRGLKASGIQVVRHLDDLDAIKQNQLGGGRQGCFTGALLRGMASRALLQLFSLTVKAGMLLQLEQSI